MAQHPTCRRPDHDEPRMVCGYPLPCPHHTVLIDATSTSETTVTIPIASSGAAAHYRHLLDLGDAVGPMPKKRRR